MSLNHTLAPQFWSLPINPIISQIAWPNNLRAANFIWLAPGEPRRLFARDETDIAARNRRVVQSRFRKRRGAPFRSFFGFGEDIFVSEHARSTRRSETLATVRRQKASHN